MNFQNKIYKWKYSLYPLCKSIINKAVSWSFFCFMIALACIGQILISNNCWKGLICIFDNSTIDVFQNISISYLSGYILWVLTSVLPQEQKNGYLRKKMKDNYKKLYCSIWVALNQCSKESISWRPLGWLGLKYKNSECFLSILLNSKVNWQKFIKDNDYNQWFSEIEKNYDRYSDVMNKDEQFRVERILEAISTFKSQSNLQIAAFSAILTHLYWLSGKIEPLIFNTSEKIIQDYIDKYY